MIPIGESERALQNRVIAFFRQRLGDAYPGNLQDRANRNILPEALKRILSLTWMRIYPIGGKLKTNLTHSR